jgi:hypothetical protein
MGKSGWKGKNTRRMLKQQDSGENHDHRRYSPLKQRPRKMQVARAVRCGVRMATTRAYLIDLRVMNESSFSQEKSS